MVKTENLRILVNALWVISAVTLASGFGMGSLSTIMRSAAFHLGGIVLIAVGIAVAALGWIVDDIAARRAH
jgi:hypothetical protein